MGREGRKSKRKIINKLVEYFLIPSATTRTFDGLITDVSDCGLCLVTNSQLKYGQRIIIQDEPYLSEKVAIVRWTQKFDDIFYKIGLEFLEDQAFIQTKDKRLCRRLNTKHLHVYSKAAFTNYIRIINMSLDGLSIETDRKLNIGKEYILRFEHEGKIWPIKGYVAWSILKDCKSNEKGDVVPIYAAGMKLTIAAHEMQEMIKFTGMKPREGKGECFSFRLDEFNIRGKGRKNLQSLQSVSR